MTGTVARRVRDLLNGRSEDRGSAIVEFLGVSLVLLVPIVYLIITMSRVQAAAFAAEGAARESGRIVSQAATWQEATATSRAAVELAFADQGFDVDAGTALRASCSEQPCLSPGSQVLIEVATVVDLPLVPDAVSAVLPTTVPVSATHLAVVGEFRERP